MYFFSPSEPSSNKIMDVLKFIEQMRIDMGGRKGAFFGREGADYGLTSRGVERRQRRPNLVGCILIRWRMLARNIVLYLIISRRTVIECSTMQ